DAKPSAIHSQPPFPEARGRATSTPRRAARRPRAGWRRRPGRSRVRGRAASAATRRGGTARSRRRRIRRHARVALGPDVAWGPPWRHGDAIALLLRQAQHHLHRVLELVHRAHREQAAPHHVVEELLSLLGAQDGDRPVHRRHAPARDVGELAGEIAAVVALGAGVLLRAVEVHLHQLAVRLVDHHFALDVELLHLRQRDAHLVLDLPHHEALVGEHLGAEEADGEAHDVAEALQVLRLPLDVLRLLAAVVQPRGVGDLDLARGRDLAGHADEADLRADVEPDALADAAVIEGGRRLGHLLRLPVDVVDDVVRADEDAGTALAAAPVGDHLVHHLLEARMLDHRADTIRRRFAVSIAGRKPYYHPPMLSDAELRVLRAVAEALIPPGGPFPLGAGDVGTAERLARYLQRMAPETQGQVRLLLRAWEAAPLASRHLR